MFRLPLEYYLLRFGHWTARFIFWLLTCIEVSVYPLPGRLISYAPQAATASEMRELLILQKRLLSYSGQNMGYSINLCERALGRWSRLSQSLRVCPALLLLLFMGILKDEGYFQIPDLDPKDNLSITDTWRLAGHLPTPTGADRESRHRQQCGGHLKRFFDLFVSGASVSTAQHRAYNEAQTFSVPLHGFLRDPAEAIEVILGITIWNSRQQGLFKNLLETL